VQSSRKSKSNADGFLYEVLTFPGDSAQGGVDAQISLNKGLCFAVFKRDTDKYPACHGWCHAAV